jgi:hypothetical protein
VLRRGIMTQQNHARQNIKLFLVIFRVHYR